MSRSNIEKFNQRFDELHKARCGSARSAEGYALYAAEGATDVLLPNSAATLLVRSAAVVEQMINGITVRLWDDPFEWTLPERMAAGEDLIAYFEEVETARLRGFEFFRDDSDLDRSIPAPKVLRTLDEVLIDALSRSEAYLSKAKIILSRRKSS